MKNNFKTIFTIFSIFFIIILSFTFLFYFLILPKAIESKFISNYAKKIVKEQLKMDLEIKNPKLETSFKPEIEFEIEKIALSKENKSLFELDDFEIEIEFDEIFQKIIKLKELNAKKIIIKADELLANLPEQKNKNNKPFEYKIKFLDGELKLDEVQLSYLQNKTLVQALIKQIELEKGSLNFNSKINVLKNKNNLIKISANPKDRVKVLKDEIQVNDLNILLNDSNLKLNSKINQKGIFLNAKSNKFYLDDVFKIINSNLVLEDGESLLSPLKNPKGNVAFDVNLNNSDLSGIINVNNTKVELKDVSNIPLKVATGQIKITKDKINFQNLKGYYGKNKNNKFSITGDIKDYYKTFDSNIVVESSITNEFFVDYLAPLINNTKLYVSKPSKTKIIYKSKNQIMDIIWFAQIDKGVNFGVTKEKSALSDYDRAVLGEFQINGDKLNIKNINYYIASNIVRGVKLKPILQMNAMMNLEGKIDKAGFAFDREMPCEFLNVFLGEGVFKKGTIKGNIDVAFKNNIPYLNADLKINKTLIPSQRMFIKEASMSADDSLVYLNASGKFKRANYDFKGKLKNGLIAPYIFKNLELNVDNLDIERVLASFNNQTTAQNQTEKTDIKDEDEILDDNYMFDSSLIRIENCNFKLANGNYKELTFGNINANLTLDDKGILRIKSNKFDIANGTSDLKVECDLNKLKYYIRLGVKGIDSKLMAKTLFNLGSEISGASDGLIELYGDETLKMNGSVKFLINDGTIGKIGLVEYLMKIASVFRNPIVMVSPATIMDIISVPEGKFDKIVGNIQIKDNVLAPIDIKSYSKSLSALIKGKFDLERHDASLRIYTRFSTDKKSMFGILRNVSLNSLANRVKRVSNEENYYASELSQLPQIEAEENKTQIFLTQVEGDIEHFNFLSSLKKIK